MVFTNSIRTGMALFLAFAGLMAFSVMSGSAQSTPTTDQPVTVGDTELTWSGDWQYDTASSMDAQATLTQLDPASQSLQLASYGVFADKSVEDADAALRTFTDAFFQSAGAEAIQESGSGELEDGAIWKVYSFDLQGLQLSLVVKVSQTDNGEFVVSTLTANTESFADSISAAQEEIMLDGEPTFLDGIDPQEATANLGGQASPVASPEATPAT